MQRKHEDEAVTSIYKKIKLSEPELDSDNSYYGEQSDVLQTNISDESQSSIDWHCQLKQLQHSECSYSGYNHDEYDTNQRSNVFTRLQPFSNPFTDDQHSIDKNMKQFVASRIIRLSNDVDEYTTSKRRRGDDNPPRSYPQHRIGNTRTRLSNDVDEHTTSKKRRVDDNPRTYLKHKNESPRINTRYKPNSFNSVSKFRMNPQRQFDSRRHAGDKITRRNNKEDNNSEFVWDLKEMEINVHRDAIQIAGDEKIIKCIHNFLRSHVSCSDISRMAIFLRILSNIANIRSYNPSNSDQATVLIEDLNIFSSECISFWGSLAIIIRKLPSFELEYARNFQNQVCKLVEIFLEHNDDTLRQSAIPYLPLDDFHGALKQISNHDSDSYKKTLEKVGEFLHIRDTSTNFSERKPDHHHHDHHSFVLKVILKPSNLNYRGLSPDIRPNKIVGCYESKCEYLKTHFELLKEDFVYPLRLALQSFRGSAYDMSTRNGNNYYSNVKLVGKDVSDYALVYKLNFKICGASTGQINWEYCKRFTFGSLICLSEDQFETKIFASVAERKIVDLKENIISVRLIGDHLSQGIQQAAVYNMIESPAYLEAYAPVLMRLSDLIENRDSYEMVFEKYFVYCDKNVSAPPYLSFEETTRDLDLRAVICDCRTVSKCEHDYYSNVDVTKNSFWSELQSAVLDASQKEALQLALTHEVAIIQGPPGTGKTFIGLKFVELLLRNRGIYTSRSHLHQPLLIMCNTNHALDQFLEGIVKLRKNKEISINIVRVGGRSKSEVLKEFTLHEKKIKARKEQKTNKKQRRYRVRSELPQIQAKCDALEDLCESRNYYPINEEIYFSFLHPDELNKMECHYLKDAISCDQPELRYILEWFHVKTKPKEEKKMDFLEHQADEDDRNIRNEGKSKGSEVIGIAVNHRKDLRALFKELQSVYPEPHQHCEVHQHKLELFKYCLRERLRELQLERSELIEKKEFVDKDEQCLSINILKEADVIGFTTTGASAHIKILTQVRSKIVIVEEAAEIMEAHIISALTRHTQHLVMIGDHQQLRPKVQDYTIGTKYRLEISLFERLIKNNFPYVTLKEQHRMRPEISQLLHPHIYHELIDHDSVKKYPSIKGVANNVFFISHHEKEKDIESLKSPSNIHEASFMSLLCQYLLKQGYKSTEITVITPYTGQVACLKNEFTRLKIKGVHIVPVDCYQGEENDIILLSLVRSEKPGFVKDENRVCVALSRAKKGFYCIGNFDLFARYSRLWRNIIGSMKQQNLVGSHLTLKCEPHEIKHLVSKAQDFNKVPEGGCSKVCGVRRPNCGHICSRKCHPYDSNEAYHPGECTKPCIRMCKAGHKCKLRCNEDCKCDVRVKKLMPMCNHKQSLRCDANPYDHVCAERCDKLLECSHPCRAKCGEHCDVKKCMFLIQEVLPCGHKAQRKCSETALERMKRCQEKCKDELDCGHKCTGTCGNCNQGRLHMLCIEKCERVLMCGHVSTVKCSQTCPLCKERCPVSCSHGKCGHVCGTQSCIRCAEPCQWNCYHQKCNKPCGAICDRTRCDRPCRHNLPCHHQCMGLCKEKCPNVCRRCDPSNDAFQIFFGSEDDYNAKFIQLNECGHVFEYRALDTYMDSDGTSTIGFKKCPKCNSLICNPPMRYCNVIKKIKRDMNLIKKRKNTLFTEEERQQVIREISEMADKRGKEYFTTGFKKESLHMYNDCLLQKHHIILCALSINHSHADTVIENVTYSSLFADISEETQESVLMLTSMYKTVKWQLDRLHQFVNSEKLKSLYQLPLQTANDIQHESTRLTLLLKWYQVKAYMFIQDVNLDDSDENAFMTLMDQLDPGDFKPCFLMSHKEEHCRVLNRIQRTYELVGISEEEIKMVTKAMDTKKGAWYKCPNGHLYNIGQCGGAMEEGSCPECGSAIGGTNHQLLNSNFQHSSVGPAV